MCSSSTEVESELGWELHYHTRTQGREQAINLMKNGGSYCNAPNLFPDVNFKDKAGTTPLWWACMYGDEQLAKMIVDAGADINTTDEYGWSPASIAARYGHDNCLRLLLDAGADLSMAVSDGDTALDKAIFWEHADCERLLLANGAVTRKPDIVQGSDLAPRS